MSDAYFKNVIEAALLAAGRPVSISELQQVFEEHSRPAAKEMRAHLEQLAADYEGRGVTIKETANGFRFQVRSEFSQEVSRLWPDRPKKYTRALLETLALIAYRQPITRAEIENVRGVAVNPEIVKTLMERNWVRVVGHRDVPGRPELLGTTPEFLDYFSLKSIEDLPPLAELKSLSDLNLQLPLAVEGQPAEGQAQAGQPAEGQAAAEGQPAENQEGGEVAPVPDTVAADSGEVAVVNVSADDAPAEEQGEKRRDEGGLDAAPDDEDEEELSAPGNSAAELVAAPPRDE